MAVITTIILTFLWLVTAENRVIRAEEDVMNRLAMPTYFFWPDAGRELALLIGFSCYAIAAFLAWFLLFSFIDVVASTLQARTNEKTRVVIQLQSIRTRPALLFIAVCAAICALPALNSSRIRPGASGIAATAHQAGLAVIAPTYIAANHIGMFFSRASLPHQPGTIEQWSAYNQSVRTVSWFAFPLLTAAELWPLLLLCFRPWSSLSRSTRAAVIIYSSILVAAFIAAFVYVRLKWSVILD